MTVTPKLEAVGLAAASLQLVRQTKRKREFSNERYHDGEFFAPFDERNADSSVKGDSSPVHFDPRSRARDYAGTIAKLNRRISAYVMLGSYLDDFEAAADGPANERSAPAATRGGDSSAEVRASRLEALRAELLPEQEQLPEELRALLREDAAPPATRSEGEEKRQMVRASLTELAQLYGSLVRARSGSADAESYYLAVGNELNGLRRRILGNGSAAFAGQANQDGEYALKLLGG